MTAIDDARPDATTPKRETLTFDDFQIGNVGDIPAFYGGLSWLSMYAMNSHEYLGDNRHSGYVRGTTSGEQIAYLHTIGAFATINSASTMTFVSARMTAANDLSLVVDVYGYHNNVVIDHATVTLNDRHPLKFEPGWTGVDYIYFRTGAETPDPKAPTSGDYVVFDDIKLADFAPDSAGPAFAHVAAAAFGTDHHPVAALHIPEEPPHIV